MVARLLGASLISANVLLVCAAVAADSSTPTVVVTGQRTTEDVDTVVSRFIDQHAAPNRKTGQYMRDDVWPICPVTLGLPPAYNAFVTSRVLAVATKVGAKVGGAGCKSNVQILFTDQPHEVVEALSQKTRGAILGAHYVHETSQLLEVTHPIQAWYVTGTRYDENSISPVISVDRQSNTKPLDDKHIGMDDAYWNAPSHVALGSNIPMRRISAIANVLIIADLKAVGGSEIGPVADYIAMLALSEPRSLDDCNPLPSILDLMSTACAGRAKPVALTDNDWAYLKGLYTADLGARSVSEQKEGIENGMKGEMGK